MSNPPVVIDTCSFYNREFMRWIRTYRGDREIPPVVYCELALSAIHKSGDTSALDGLLYGAGIAVSDMLMEHGRRAAELARGDPKWKERWRDYLIAAHAAYAPYRVVTENIKDFACLGARAIRPSDFKYGILDGTIR